MKSKPTRKMQDSDQKPSNEEIASAAYQLYVESGYQDGKDEENWLRAENSLTQKMRGTNAQTAQPQSSTTNQSLEIRNKDLQWNPERAAKPAATASRTT